MHNKTLAVSRSFSGELLLDFLKHASFTLLQREKAAKRRLTRLYEHSDRHQAEFNIQFPPLNGMFGSHRVGKLVHKAALSPKNGDEEPSKLWNFKGKKKRKKML